MNYNQSDQAKEIFDGFYPGLDLSKVKITFFTDYKTN